MKKVNFKVLTAAVLVAAFGIFGIFRGNSVSAAGRALAISPMSQRVVLNPGETYQGGITVSNPANSSEDLYYAVSIGSYSSVKAEGSKDYSDWDVETVTSYNDIMDWITIDNPKGVVKPNGQVLVSFKINVPEDAPAGGQYATLLVREDAEARGEDDGNVAVTEVMQMASIIYAEVAGETVKEGVITENSIPGLILSNTLEATSLAKNSGNVHTDIEYVLQVWPLFSDEEICTRRILRRV